MNKRTKKRSHQLTNQPTLKCLLLQPFEYLFTTERQCDVTHNSSVGKLCWNWKAAGGRLHMTERQRNVTHNSSVGKLCWIWKAAGGRLQTTERQCNVTHNSSVPKLCWKWKAAGSRLHRTCCRFTRLCVSVAIQVSSWPIDNFRN